MAERVAGKLTELHPYRAPRPPTAPPREPAPAEERVIMWMLVVVGGLRVAVALINAERFDAEATIALLAFCLGVAWGLRSRRSKAS